MTKLKAIKDETLDDEISCTVDEENNRSFICGLNQAAEGVNSINDENNVIGDVEDFDDGETDFATGHRIIQGIESVEHKYPWLVSLRERASNGKPRKCSLILNRKYIRFVRKNECELIKASIFARGLFSTNSGFLQQITACFLLKRTMFKIIQKRFLSKTPVI